MRNRMSSQRQQARQCVRHARYRQYQTIRFYSLFRPPGDGNSGQPLDHPRASLCYCPPRCPTQPHFCHQTPPRTPVFPVSATNNEAFNEPTPRLLRVFFRWINPRTFLLFALSFAYTLAETSLRVLSLGLLFINGASERGSRR